MSLVEYFKTTYMPLISKARLSFPIVIPHKPERAQMRDLSFADAQLIL